MTSITIHKSRTVGKSESLIGGNKSVIVYGPQGCGKSTHAEALARHFGLSVIHDDDYIDQRKYRAAGTLYLTCVKPEWVPDEARRCFSFDDAMRMVGIR